MNDRVFMMETNPSPLLFYGLVLGMFFYLFPVVFVPVGLPLAMVAYLIFAALWATRPTLVPLSALPLGVAAILLILAIYASFVTLHRGMNDLTFAVQMAKVATLYLGSGVLIGIICVSMKASNTFNIIVRAFVICCLIQSAFIAISIISIQFRVVMDYLFTSTGNTNYLVSFRVRGFSASGGPALGLSQAIGVLSSLYMLMSTKKSHYFYIAIAIWIPTFFVARTGFFLGAIFIFVYFLSVKRIGGVFGVLFLRPIGLIGLVLISASLLVILPNLSYFFEPEALERVDFALIWGFELLLNAQTGVAETDTTNAVLNMLVIPEELSYFIFGLGVFDNGANDAFGYARTDSGYLKTWYSSGFIGVLVLYFSLYMALLVTAWRFGVGHFKIYVIIFVMTMAVVEIKEPFLYQNYLARYAFILIGAGAVINWDERRRARKSRP